jgi:hypothetical protein
LYTFLSSPMHSYIYFIDHTYTFQNIHHTHQNILYIVLDLATATRVDGN